MERARELSSQSHVGGAEQREVLAKVLTKNDDSGRHGVLIPDAAYSFFPELPIPDPDQNARTSFLLKDLRTGDTKPAAWIYYQRYPERRVTKVNTGINVDVPRIVVFTRTTSTSRATEYTFEFSANAAEFARLVARYFKPNGIEPIPGAFIRTTEGASRFVEDDSLKEVLRRFDRFHNQWVGSQREGPTGLGYTLESLMGVKENNDKAADLLGIELKAKLKKDKARGEGKTNLFQQAPEWTQTLTNKELIRKIGKREENGRWSCYSAVTTNENNLGLHLVPADPRARVDLNKRTEPIGFWPFTTLEKRLAEKHSRAVFIKAESSVRAGATRFAYRELVYCERPKIENFISLVKTGDIIFEFTMSEKEDGSIRNHGYPWRLKDQSLLDRLFSFSLRLRD